MVEARDPRRWDGPEHLAPTKKPRTQRARPTRRPQQSERAREDILDAANRIIATYGFREATIDLIAEAAGISPASIYWHFGNRQGMLAALATRIAERYQEAVELEFRDAMAGRRMSHPLDADDLERYVRIYARAVSEFALRFPQVIRSQTALSSEGVLLRTMRD